MSQHVFLVTLNVLTNKERLQLLDQLSTHKRFKNSKLSNFVNDIDVELQKQFAAMTYRLNLDTYLIFFVAQTTVLLAGRKISI